MKARYVGVCRGCGAYTQPRNGKGDAYRYCKRCHPGAIQPHWTPNRVLAAMRNWQERYGRLPSSYDWSRTHARLRGGEALERLSEGQWPSASLVSDRLGGWAAARAAAQSEDDLVRREHEGEKGAALSQMGRAARSTSDGESRLAIYKFAQRAWSSTS